MWRKITSIVLLMAICLPFTGCKKQPSKTTPVPQSSKVQAEKETDQPDMEAELDEIEKEIEAEPNE